MFNLSADCSASEPIFAAAARHLGKDPRHFVREAAAEALFSDRAGQILCCTQALALWAALETARPQHAAIAGYSVGELAAWGCAGALDAYATLQLTHTRAAIMDAVAPEHSGLAGIDITAGSDKLAKQICAPVDWAACRESRREADTKLVLELGPGTALSGMAARLFPEGRVRSSDDFHTLIGLRNWLSRALD
jgi:malonyl CoA-acyl carrier protein transacylase